MAADRSATSGDRGPVPEGERRGPLYQRVALVVILVGIALAVTGLATFKAPTCTGVSPTTPATCSAWETSQWLMIGGVLLAVPALLYLANVKMHERLAEAAAPTTDESAR